MDPLAVQQVKLKELIQRLDERLESDQRTNRKVSLEMKAKLSRMRARLTRSQAGYSREAAKEVLVAVLREAVTLAIKLLVEAFIRSAPDTSTCVLSTLPPPFADFVLRAA